MASAAEPSPWPDVVFAYGERMTAHAARARQAMTSNQPTAPFRDRRSDKAALLIIDMISRFDFECAEILKPKALRTAKAIGRLRAEAETADCPVVFINDNFGEWHSERSRLIERARETGNHVIEAITPCENDYFIIKPQFSGFYATNLPVLLPKLGVRRLILTGIATDICVLFTAADAHMRDYALWVPVDCVAAVDDQRSRWALEIMRESMGAETRSTGEIDLTEWLDTLEDVSPRDAP